MENRFRLPLAAAAMLVSAAVLPACAGPASPGTGQAAPQASKAAKAVSPKAPAARAAATALPLAVVHKNPSCGCCNSWVEHLRKAGFRVEVREEDNLDAIKQGLGVPPGKGSCHTAEIGGYVVEGHVPASDIKRLLAEKPDARGLVLPGMPMGSPGMEMPDGRVQPYTVELVRRDGSTAAYARHGR